MSGESISNTSNSFSHDFFHTQTIFAFHNDITLVDPDLLCKGRVNAKYCFKELTH